MGKLKYDSTVARMAGNIAGGLIHHGYSDTAFVAKISVELARAIIAEVQRTTPVEPE